MIELFVALNDAQLDADLITQISAHSAEVIAAENGEAPDWIPLAPVGSFKGVDGRGPWTIDNAEAVIANSVKRLGNRQMVVDFDHATDRNAESGVAAPAPAAGWITDYEVRDDGIYGKVEWTEKGRTAIQSREYRYLSPVFLHTKKGKVIYLARASMVNAPNLDLPALNSMETSQMDIFALLRTLFGLSANADETTIGEFITALNAALSEESLPKLLGIDADTADALAEALNSTAGSADGLSQIRTVIGAGDDTEVETLVTAINTMKGQIKDGNPDPSKFVPASDMADLQKQLNDLQKTVFSDKGETAINQAIEDGRLAPALKDWGLSLHAEDPAKFEEFVANAPQLSKDHITRGQPSKNTEGLDDGDMAICAALGVDPKAFAATRKSEQGGEA